MAARPLRIGTRASLLARTQTQWVADQLSGRGVDVEIELVETSGDQRTDIPIARIGGDGVFVRELERALLDGRIDVAAVADEVARGAVIRERHPGGTAAPVVARAQRDGLFVRGTVSCALGCPYEGAIAVAAVRDVAQRLLDIGVDEISIADTIGVGTPELTNRVFGEVLALVDAARVNAHFHDTYQRALENLEACLALGVTSIDASAAGLGGCPYAPGATGNVATEAVLELLALRGYETGVDLAQVRAAGTTIRAVLRSA